MVEQRVDGLVPAVNHLHDRWREPRGIEQFEDPSRCDRHAFGGFQQEAIASGDRVRQKPERDHAREIEGRNRRHDPQRLADQMLIDARRDVLVIAPCIRIGIPQATSTFSMVRRISAVASAYVFPHSSVMVCASESR